MNRLPLTQKEAEALAHRRATKYTHRSDPTYHSYAFVPHTLMDFVRDVEAVHGMRTEDVRTDQTQVTHYLNHTRTAAVAADTFWMPIDANTPRNVKCLAISRQASGVAQQAEIPTNNIWWTHWHPLPRFRPEPMPFLPGEYERMTDRGALAWAGYDPEDDQK